MIPLEEAPEQKLRAVEERIERATREGGVMASTLVEWRQECLALAQLACRTDTGAPDRYQLGRACGNLAAAYLAAGAADAALRHAERAEALLLSEAGRTDAAAMLPHVLQTLANAHAKCEKYRRAAEYFNRALAASTEVFGKGHVSCCPVLRGWARMAVKRNGDYPLAIQLLSKELEVRQANMGRQPSPEECDELVALGQELAEMMLQAAKQVEAQLALKVQAASAKGGAGAAALTPAARSAELQRASELRDKAIQLLLASAQGGQGGAGAAAAAAAPLNEDGARMAVKLGHACVELEQWAQAEAAFLRAIPYLEEAHGMSDSRVLRLWDEVARLRLRLGKHEQAAEDYEHLLAMQAVLHGEGGAQLIATAEALCKARVLLKQYDAAHAALRRAHGLSVARHGERDAGSTRIAQVLASLKPYLTPDPDSEERGAAAGVATGGIALAAS